jgi:hypothetical protein
MKDVVCKFILYSHQLTFYPILESASQKTKKGQLTHSNLMRYGQ